MSEIPRGIEAWSEFDRTAEPLGARVRLRLDNRVAPMLWTQPTRYPDWCYGFIDDAWAGGSLLERWICATPVVWGEFADWAVVRRYHAKYPLRDAIGA